MKRIPWLLGAAAVLGACNPPAPPAAPGPEEGRYEYTGRYLSPGQAQPHEFRGVLVINEANRERLTGQWLVSGFETTLQFGTFIEGGYDVGAEVDHMGLRGTFKHRLVPAEGGTWRCTAVFVGRVDGTPLSNPATCSVTRVRA